MTGMRIQMHYASSITDPCATLDYGDVQDYAVNIIGGTNTPIHTSAFETSAIQTDNAVKMPEDAVDLKVIPNPLPNKVAPTVNYTLAKKGNTSMMVVDLSGKVIQRADLGMQDAGRHNYLLSLPGNRLTAGFYILILEQDKGIIARTRFIVQ